MTGTGKITGIFRRAIAGVLALAGLGAPAYGQTTPDPQVISPLRVESEVNGVNVATGRTTPDVPVLSVPAAPNLRFDRAQNAAPYVNGRIYQNFDMGGEARRFAFHLGEASDSIECFDGAPCESKSGSGAIVPKSGQRYVQAGTGILYRFNVLHLATVPVNWERQILFYVGSVEHPDGETLTYSYDDATLTTDQFGRTWRRPARITSNRGFYIALTYQPGELGEIGWGTVAQATLYASADPATPLGRLTYSGNTVTDLAGRVYTCTCNASLGAPTETVSASMQLPGDTAPSVQTTGHPTLNLVNAVTRDGVSSTYSYANPQFEAALSGPAGTGYSYSALTVTGAGGYHQVYNLGVFLAKGLQYVTGMTDSLNRTTAYSYDNLYRVTQITYPELNSALITYDARGNATSLTRRARPGTGLADIVESANYETGNCNPASPPPPVPGSLQDVLCWRPTWTRDGMLRQTDYAYNERGQLTERLDPADAGGVRRRTSISYASSPAGISRPAEVRVCADTGATCATNAQVRTQYQYWGDTNLATLERRIDGATGAMLDTAYSYDPAGRLLATDGPLDGGDDTVYNRYDTLGRRTWEIGGRGEGGVRIARRFTYRQSDDKPTVIETGTLPDETSEALANVRRTEIVYDSRRNPIRETVSAGGTVFSVTDKAYDDRGNLICTAVRMNLAAVPPPSATAACGPGTDRITTATYDAAGQRLQLREGVGSDVEGTEATWNYNLNGQITTVIDGNGNRALLCYDGFGRQSRWVFPSPNRPANFIDTSQATALDSAGAANGSCTGAEGDFESYEYDAAGNRTNLRKRDTRNIVYAYDALNRVTAKTYPQGGATAVHYGYDLRNLQLFARFGSPTGEGVTSQYDGFGRLVSSSTDMGGTTRTLSYAWDAAGNRTRVTHPDGQYFDYRRDALGRLISIRENGDSDVVGQYYHATGERYVTGNSAGATGWLYDGIGRLNYLVLDQPHGATVTWNFLRNPANQITSATRSNDTYAWTSHYGVARAYTTDGLNRYSRTDSTTAAGPASASFAYELNGNLTSDGSRTYTYDVENRLVQTSDGFAMSYDPLGRLFQAGGGSSDVIRYLYDGDALVAEYTSSGAMLRRYVHGSGVDEPLLWYEGSTVAAASRRHLGADHQGSIVSVTDSAGATIAINRYDEYGIPALTNAGRFGYTGQTWLPALGMYHYKARIYSPTLGRFLQTDPVGYQGGINLYGYVGNDPGNAADPTGNGPEIVLCAFTGPAAPFCVGGDLIVSGLVIAFGGATVMSLPNGPQYPASNRNVSGDDNGGPPLDDDPDLQVAAPPPADRIGARADVLNRRHYQAATREGRGEVVARRPDGRPFDHITEVREAANGLRNDLVNAERVLRSGRLNAAQTTRLRTAVARGQRVLNEARAVLRRIDSCSTGSRICPR